VAAKLIGINQEGEDHLTAQRNIHREAEAKKEREAAEREKAETAEQARIAEGMRIEMEAQKKLDREKAEAEKLARKEARRPWLVRVREWAVELAHNEVPKGGRGCGDIRKRLEAERSRFLIAVAEIINEEEDE